MLPEDVAGAIRSAAARILKLPLEELSAAGSLFSHGLSSLGAVQLCDELAWQFGIKIPVAWIWAYATPRNLAEVFCASESSKRPGQGVAPEPVAGAPSNREPIAIVGIGCRLPGEVDSPRELWAALRSQRNGIVEAPSGRPDVAAGWSVETLAAEGRPRLGGFRSDIAEFDAAFFGISPAEARQMDPQQRLALETTWSALEDACIVPATLRRSKTGVFYGVVWREYEALLRSPESLTTHSTVGGENSIIAARVAYVLDLRGPALTINTACSSSLVALHLTMHSLRRGEIDVGLAGGVNLLLSSKTTAGLVRFGGLSPTSESRPFDAGANGYVRGEGSCVFVLRRLSDARRDGQRIYGLLLGSAANNDGASNGLTAPNPEAQSAVIRTCWREAGVPLHAVGYVEAHGTGTALGDPIEALALSEVFAEHRSTPLLIGSFKGSIGHLEGASGAAGLAKLVLSLKHGVLPAQVGYQRPNPLIDFEGLKLSVVDRERDWPEPPDGGARYAGISSFGWGGTNVHVAVQEALGRRSELIPVSGGDEEALRGRARAYLQSRESARAWPLGDAADSVRFVARGRNRGEALAALDAVAVGNAPVAEARGEAARMAWLFSGFGSHWPGMAMDLLTSQGTFRQTLVECDEIARAVAGAPFLDELTRWQRGAPLLRPTLLFSMVFSVQLGLARVLGEWGLRPEVVFGQSLGEWAAAAICGALSLEDGVRVVTACQAVCDKLSGRGSVFLAELSLARAEALLAARQDTVQLAGTLGPHQVILGGGVDDVARLRAELAKEGIRTWSTAMDYPAHTRLMQEVMPEYRVLLAELRPRRAHLPLWSTTVGGFVSGDELNAEYWVRHLCEPVRLTHAIQALAKSATCFVEIAPHPVVSRALEASLEEVGKSRAQVFCTGRRDAPARETLEELATALWCNGASLDWDRVTGTARDTARPLLISGRDEPSLRRQAARWATWLEREAAPDWLTVTRGAALKRTHFEWRASVIARDAHEGAARLRALSEGRSDTALVWGKVDQVGALAVLFTGQGSQRPGMGRELYQRCPAFRAGLDEVLDALGPHLDVDLREMMQAPPGSGESTRLDDTEYTQPALFAFEVALYRQWQAWGVQPSVVLGHSVGELSAAYASGVLSLEDAARLVCARGRLMQRCRADGAMASVQASAEDVARLLEQYQGVEIAGLNAPEQTVISGDANAVEAVKRQFELAGKRVTALRVSHAFHSHHMDAMAEAYRQEARCCDHRPAATGWLSLVNGSWLEAGQTLEPEYWVDQARQAVNFVGGMRVLASRGIRTFLECGPDGVLTGLGMQCVAGGRFVTSVRRQADEHAELLKALAQLHVQGHELFWTHVFEQAGEVSPELPTYEFSRNHYWLPRTEEPALARAVGMEAEAHGILRAGTQVAGDVPITLLSGVLDPKDQPWLSGHQVHGGAVFPGTGFLELALAAGRSAGAGEVKELTLVTPLRLPERAVTRVQVKLAPGPIEGQQLLEIHAQSGQAEGGAAWTQHAIGLLAAEPTRHDADAFRDLSEWPVEGAEAVELGGLYQALRDCGLDYGNPFRGLRELWRDEQAMYALIDVPSGLELESYGIHPAMLDAALHCLASAGSEGPPKGPLVPYEWCAVRLYRRGARQLRVKVTLEEEGQSRVARLVAVDGQGLPVLHVGALRLRRWSAEAPSSLAAANPGELHRLAYAPIAVSERQVEPRGQDDAVVHAALGPGRLDSVLSTEGKSFEELLARVEEGAPVPRRLWVDATAQLSDGSDLLASAHRLLSHAQTCLQRWYRTPHTAACELVWVTRDALTTGPDECAADLVNGSVLGMIRALRAEHPERQLRLVDLGSQAVTQALLVSALESSAEPELALREGLALASQLAAVDAESDALQLPAAEPWQLDLEERGRLDRFRCSTGRRDGALAPGEIRVAVRAAGVNFRDLLHALDMVHAPAFGLECAGVVVEVGRQVRDLRVGDRVMGMALGCFGSEVRVDARTMVKMPAALTYAQAATIPVAFATALYGLRDLGQLQPGQRVLIHAAAGGVGMAAVQIARVLGAEVFGTASEGKWEHLRSLGLDPARIASSRDLAFERKWIEQTRGEGFDVVLNALSGVYVDASLRLLPRGGRFVEMGKTDQRNPEQIAQAHPGVCYQTFDLLRIDAEHTAELLREIVGLLGSGRIRPLPVKAYDVRHAPHAFRYMARARHVGKLVLTVPRPLDSGGTVLVTGATGQLGRAITEHLVGAHGVRHLLLTSRQGASADGARAWLETLRQHWGCHAQVVACDVSERAELKAALAQIDPAHPLTGVFHLAGVLEDGAFDGQTPASLTRVLKPKLDGSLWLDELTQSADLSAFVLFSSVTAALGNPGQTNYAAANAFMDALASARRGRGQPGLSLAWGLWQPASDGMGAHLNERQLARLRRSGVRPMTIPSGLQLLDQALCRPESYLVPAALDRAALRSHAERAPAVGRSQRVASERPAKAQRAPWASLGQCLLEVPERERLALVVSRVQETVASVLGLPSVAGIPVDRPLAQLGLDSLTSVELRRHLAAHAGHDLPASLLFDYPTVTSVAKLLLQKLGPAPTPTWSDREIRTKLARVSIDSLRSAGLLAALMQQPESDAAEATLEQDIQGLDDAGVLQALDELLK
jgi:acyl transferase domain-containing protein/acyl carrier protein